MSGKPDRTGEFELIAKFFAPLAKGEPGALGLKDDAAYLKPRAGHDITTDAVIAGVHFLADDPPDTIAQKALRVNLSDLAAKGAKARAYLLTAALPTAIDDEWLQSFAAGLKQDQKRFGVTLIGGDTTKTPGPLTLNIVAIGEVPYGKMLTRAGAKPGDDIWVTGTIGDGALGLKARRGTLPGLSDAHRKAAERRYLTPEPRPTVGKGLVGIANACLDVSDGLVADLGHIAKTSNVAIRIRERDVPLSAPAKAAVACGALAHAELLTGGDDYELAFAAPQSARAKVQSLSRDTRVPLTRIGEVAKGPTGVTVLAPGDAAIPYGRGGYVHF
jgi:thiamine-monophosphate kinase